MAFLTVPLEPWHITAMQIRPEQEDLTKLLDSCGTDLETYANVYLESAALEQGEKCAWTLMGDGKILACGGIVQILPHVGEAWMIFSKDIAEADKRHIVALAKRVKRAVRNVSTRRVQAMSQEGFEDGERFLRFLGMEKEGLIRSYGIDGSNYLMYSYVGE